MLTFREQRHISFIRAEVDAPRCSGKKMFLEISQNSQENTGARVFLNKVAGLRTETLLKKRLSKNTFFYRTPLVVASGGM